MTDTRPYFNWNIDELESLHRTTPDDHTLSQALISELKYRTTDRAFALRLQVQGAMSEQRPALVLVTPGKPAEVVLANPMPVTEVVPKPSMPLEPAAVVKRPVVTRPYTEKRNDPAAILASWSPWRHCRPRSIAAPRTLLTKTNAA